MTNNRLKLTENKGLLHKIAVLCKDFYTLKTAGDLFLFAGADFSWPNWKELDLNNPRTISKEKHTEIWITGLIEKHPDKAEQIIEGVVTQLIENEAISQGDRQFLVRALGRNATLQATVLETINENVDIPDDVERLLEILINGLPRAMFPLKYRREGLPQLAFDNEYDVQSLLHTLLRAWIKDIRVEEYTPSYAGSSTRIDFLLPHYRIVCEIKYIRDKRHGSKIGDEIIIDVAHYKAHPQCKQLWVVIYDPNSLIPNPTGLIKDLQKISENMTVKTFVLTS